MNGIQICDHCGVNVVPDRLIEEGLCTECEVLSYINEQQPTHEELNFIDSRPLGFADIRDINIEEEGNEPEDYGNTTDWTNSGC